MHLNHPDYWKQQYEDNTNLDARIRLHTQFSVNRYGWTRWVFDQLHLAPASRVLELGCGNGMLWLTNANRIDATWLLVLSDISPGMLSAASRALHSLFKNPPFIRCDAMAVPFNDASFDAVIANHMLYHVPNRDQALTEIRRLLKPGGRIFASTVGAGHMREMKALVTQFTDGVVAWKLRPDAFLLEDGGGELKRCFSDIELLRYEDALLVPEAEALVEYILSANLEGLDAQRDELSKFIEQRLQTDGPIQISKETGMFVARKSE